MRIDCAARDVVARVRAEAGDCVVVIGGGDPLDLTLARAAVPQLARERAPRRVNAVMIAQDGDSADVAAMVAYLDRAPATTGQVLELQPRVRPQVPSEASTNA